MAGLEADTSSYKQLPAASPLEEFKNFQGMEQQKLSIDKSKLELMATQFGMMNQELSTMIDDPNITKQQAAQRLNRIAATLKLPPVAVDHMMQELQQAPDVKTFSMNALRRGMDTMQKYGVQVGTNESQTDSANVYQGVRAPPDKGGGFTAKTQMPVQLPPGTGTVDDRRLINGQPNSGYGKPQLIGALGPPGVTLVAPFMPRPRQGLPVQPPMGAPPVPAVSGPTGPTVRRTDLEAPSVTDRINAAYPQRVATGLAPGEAGAIAQVSEQSGKDYATDLTRAKNFQADLYPAQAALQGIKELGTQGVGPGTEPLNQIKSAIITWLPNADPETINKVAKFEETRKYLTQIARSSGTTGTNDQLAAAFEANPSIKMSNAATETVLKSVIALRKMQHAQTLLFGQQSLPPSEYSQWISKNQNALDPRAFGFDSMDTNAKSKMLETMASKDKSGNWIAKKGKEKDFQKFEQSLSFANDAGLIEPPGRK